MNSKQCHQCMKPAVVHLTEIISAAEAAQLSGQAIGAEEAGGKRAVEMHLCMQHAIEAGLFLPVAEEQKGTGGSGMKAVVVKPGGGAGGVGGKSGKGKSLGGTGISEEEQAGSEAGAGGSGGGGSGAIVPMKGGGSSLAVTRGSRQEGVGGGCPICGMQWGQFKQAGLMGCAHDYEHFQARLLPLLKRAQEGATEHAGKVPKGFRSVEVDRQVVTLRLRRELRKAVSAEHYEQAAELRDKLRQLGN